MKYGEIKWKIEKIVFQIDGGVIKRKSEIDEGRSLIKKITVNPDMAIETETSSACSF